MGEIQNLLLDFSHTYPEGIEAQAEGLKRIDMSDIEGTDMYCSLEAEAEIRKRLHPYGAEGVHFLDNGNYHYVTRFFIEKIRVPFALVLFDHHSDMQQPMIHELTGCGSWAGEILWKNQYLKQLILIGPDPETIGEIPEEMRKKLVCISMQEIENVSAEKEIKKINMDLPAYLSIDKDVLERYYARTNWNQGNMSMETLRKLISEVFIHQAVIGADICGECSLQEPFEDFLQDSKINHMTNKILYRFISAKIEFEEYFPVMRKLSLEQQKKIKESVVEKTVKKGTVVYGEASECTGLLVVYSGMLRAYSLSEEGREITLYRLFERDVCLFSASCMLSGIQFEITIEAEKDTKLWMIPAKIWRELMEESAVLANYTNELMADRFTNVMWLIEQIMWKSFDKRLAEFLLEEIQVEGTKTLKLTHEVIGNHLGTAREVVTRMLRYFQQEGWVKLSRGTVEVADPKGLEGVVDFKKS